MCDPNHIVSVLEESAFISIFSSANVLVLPVILRYIEQTDDNILITQLSGKGVIDLTEAKQMVKSRLDYQNGKSVYLLIHFDGIYAASKKARIYLSHEGTEGILAGAFVVKSNLVALLLNFFMLIDSPAVPGKVFTDQDDALDWLRSLMKQ